ncbi:hypothetical protein NC797_07695 [Aquibacillus sp. 3ASR75-11]|uniref:Uncharacterized protein n=1 Tax=Terrihalobacillus insolitus TaxID=2950438 RepID=A0A9X4AM26_9BACI|nr:hypothetical protein [Terrihalobacillus insolitus]MDC3424389.1 hypothetical protein [Terrihalobacillus insolitus]
MALQLVVDNTLNKKERTAPTCRLNCELFDPVTKECGINHEINPDDPLLAARCGDMIYKDEDDDSVYLPEADEQSEIEYTLTEEEVDFEDEMMFMEFNGDKFNAVQSTYPEQPDYPASRDDAIWYISPCGAYGCWIVNKSQKRFMAVTNDKVKSGWSKNVYKSPYPLHNHNTALSLASRMAWYVDEEGYGQYVILANGKISMISSPKPLDWK